MKQLKLFDTVLEISDERQTYFDIVSHSRSYASKLSSELSKKISQTKITRMNLRNIVNEYYDKAIDDCLQQLSEYDVFTYTADNLKAELVDISSDLYDCVSKFEKDCESVLNYANSQIDEANREREWRQEQRNLERSAHARSFLMGVSPSILLQSDIASALTRDRSHIKSDSEIIENAQELLDAISTDEDYLKDLIDEFYVAVANIRLVLVDILKKDANVAIDEVKKEDADKSKGIMTSINSGRVPKEKINNQLIIAWKYFPLNEDIYKYILAHCPEAINDCYELMKAVGLDPFEYKAEVFANYIGTHSLKKVPSDKRAQYYIDVQTMAKNLNVKLDDVFGRLGQSSYLKSIREADKITRTIDGITYPSAEARDIAQKNVAAIKSMLAETDLLDDTSLDNTKQKVTALLKNSPELLSKWEEIYLRPAVDEAGKRCDALNKLDAILNTLKTNEEISVKELSELYVEFKSIFEKGTKNQRKIVRKALDEKTDKLIEKGSSLSEEEIDELVKILDNNYEMNYEIIDKRFGLLDTKREIIENKLLNLDNYSYSELTELKNNREYLYDSDKKKESFYSEGTKKIECAKENLLREFIPERLEEHGIVFSNRDLVEQLDICAMSKRSGDNFLLYGEVKPEKFIYAVDGIRFASPNGNVCAIGISTHDYIAYEDFLLKDAVIKSGLDGKMLMLISEKGNKHIAYSENPDKLKQFENFFADLISYMNGTFVDEKAIAAQRNIPKLCEGAEGKSYRELTEIMEKLRREYSPRYIKKYAGEFCNLVDRKAEECREADKAAFIEKEGALEDKNLKELYRLYDSLNRKDSDYSGIAADDLKKEIKRTMLQLLHKIAHEGYSRTCDELVIVRRYDNYGSSMEVELNPESWVLYWIGIDYSDYSFFKDVIDKKFPQTFEKPDSAACISMRYLFDNQREWDEILVFAYDETHVWNGHSGFILTNKAIWIQDGGGACKRYIFDDIKLFCSKGKKLFLVIQSGYEINIPSKGDSDDMASLVKFLMNMVNWFREFNQATINQLLNIDKTNREVENKRKVDENTLKEVVNSTISEPKNSVQPTVPAMPNAQAQTESTTQQLETAQKVATVTKTSKNGTVVSRDEFSITIQKPFENMPVLHDARETVAYARKHGFIIDDTSFCYNGDEGFSKKCNKAIKAYAKNTTEIKSIFLRDFSTLFKTSGMLVTTDEIYWGFNKKSILSEKLQNIRRLEIEKTDGFYSQYFSLYVIFKEKYFLHSGNFDEVTRWMNNFFAIVSYIYGFED